MGPGCVGQGCRTCRGCPCQTPAGECWAGRAQGTGGSRWPRTGAGGAGPLSPRSVGSLPPWGVCALLQVCRTETNTNLQERNFTSSFWL